MFLFNRKLSCLGISDAHLYSSYSLNKIILDHSPVFFGLVEAGNSQPGSGLLPRQPFLTAYNSTSDGERLQMAEGLGKGAGLALLADG